MENPYSRIRRLKIFGKLPAKNEIEKAILSFSKREYIIFFALIAILLVSTLSILQKINKSFLIQVPMQGGYISEGIVGTPRFINPALALSDADRDLTTLIYSGLMRKDQNGKLNPDLAEKVENSKDNLNYTFTLRDKIYFQDGTMVTADDVVFTINTVKDPILKSPRKGNFDGVVVEKIDNKTVKFTLKQPSSVFLENMTLGIMPVRLWNASPIELNDANTNPIGSGPYQITKINRESSGSINSYELTAFKKWSLEQLYLENVNLFFFSNEEDLISALEKGTVDQISSITPKNANILKEKSYRIEFSVLPRVFGLFFNQNQNQIFTDKRVIQAINEAIDKEQIIKGVLSGYGVVINDPIPPNIIAYQKLKAENIPTPKEKLVKATEILVKDGWKVGSSGFLEKSFVINKRKTNKVLEFSISTGNTPELVKSAESIQKNLQAVGMKVDVKIFETGNLNQSVIRPRNYDTLLFGQIINNESDLLAFWHSSQRKDPGLNVAMYTNAKVDKILEDAFITINEENRIKKYVQFEDEIRKDMPAVFLYSPSFIYIVSKNLQGLNINSITSPADRFLNIQSWYTQTDNVWKIFAN